jgi:predicted nucleic acid-binding Zn ribbon protein
VSSRWAGSRQVRPDREVDLVAEEEIGSGPVVPIGLALDSLLRERGMEDALILGRVASCWEDVVGPDVARQVRPHLVRGRELVVAVDHPAWATELELAGSAVLARLAEQLGNAAPQRLTVRVVPGSRR